MTVPGTPLVTDQYQLTMMQGYFKAGLMETEACFDLFFREAPFNGGYTIFAGLSEALEYLETFSFREKELSYLKSLGCFDDSFLEYLETFRFEGDVDSVAEGTAVFPLAPVLRVTAPIDQCQFIETALLNTINFQTLIATKSARICTEAGSDNVMEFGLRRAQGMDGALTASRAAYIGGCASTSNVNAGYTYGIPVSGTHAHSWVTAFDDELAAFQAYAKIYPDNTILLVDTYNTLESGVPNAIIVAQEMKAKGHNLVGVRLDSGDLAYLSIESRKMLDKAGFGDVKIVASGDLDEHIIHDLKIQGAKIDIFGVGTRLVTAQDDPALTGVYKLSAVRKKNETEWQDKLKLAEGEGKSNLPCIKNVWRLFDNKGEMIADLIEREGASPYFVKGITGVHPVTAYKKKLYTDIAEAKLLLEPVMRRGKLIGNQPALSEIRENVKKSLDALHPTMKRLLNPHIYKVSLGKELAEATAKMRGQ